MFAGDLDVHHREGHIREHGGRGRELRHGGPLDPEDGRRDPGGGSRGL
jgi:hypothetical protein